MAIPNNISKEHIERAISTIEYDSIPEQRKEKFYLVSSQGKMLPPKYVLSKANFYANGKELASTVFNAVEAKDFLIKFGFDIIIKDHSFYDFLTSFIKQANTDNLQTNSYLSNYKELKVQVSFGKGNKARIPWIAFLNNIDTVQNGTYPVYLYFKEQNIVILSFGVSETNPPARSWNIQDKMTINDYFKQNELGHPQRYGESFVFRVYKISELPSKDIIDKDLNEIIEIYNSQIGKGGQEPPDAHFYVKKFIIDLEKSGLLYSDSLITRFTASLLTKPFVILTGLSGSGKTKLAQAFVQWICADESQYCIVPVGADWTNREPLLGYPNALKPEEYVRPDSGVLDLIIRANQNSEKPYFLILDEMNLSIVERYFADFLSVMESDEEISLYAEGADANGIPAKLKVPSNLFVIGTVNIDETTNMFSPKVLDRANTIEFRVTKEEMENFLGNMKDINMDALTGQGAGMARSFLDMAANKTFASADNVEINEALVKFFGELKKTGAEFGYRSATEIMRLIHQLTVLDSNLTTSQKIDIAIMQKLLPKLHGSRRKLSPVLETLAVFCVKEENSIVKDVFEKEDYDYNNPNVIYPLSLEKISRMFRGAVDNGFASFAEA